MKEIEKKLFNEKIVIMMKNLVKCVKKRQMFWQHERFIKLWGWLKFSQPKTIVPWWL
jgi:hypothetical protein